MWKKRNSKPRVFWIKGVERKGEYWITMQKKMDKVNGKGCVMQCIKLKKNIHSVLSIEYPYSIFMN